jgi:hypothetical protein
MSRHNRERRQKGWRCSYWVASEKLWYGPGGWEKPPPPQLPRRTPGTALGPW